MERRHHRPPLEPEPPQRVGELVEAGRQLQVDVEPDVGRLVDEERERLVERRQLGRDLAQLVEASALTEPVAAPWLTS